MILVGTSGWQYDDWRGRFYPSDLAKPRWLGYFAERFPTVEVNNTFYRLPTRETFDRWREGTPDGFVVTVKASRFITHVKRLRESADALDRLWNAILRLDGKLGPVLFQLPPRFPADHERLGDFCRQLPSGIKAAFEFRDRSWEAPRTYEILDAFGAAFVLYDRPHDSAPEVLCGGWSYVRFHRGGDVRMGYPRAKLTRWADRIAGLDARDVYVYFNNDPGGAAVRDAYTLTSLLAERRGDVLGPRLQARRHAG